MKYVIFYSFLGLFFLQLSAQNIAETWAFARHAYALGEYQMAISAYRRALFFEEKIPQNEAQHEAYAALAECYTALKQPEKALYYWDIAYNQAQVDSVRHVYILGKTRCLLMAEQFPLAQAELYSLPENVSAAIRQKQLFYQGIIFFQMEKDSQARATFHAWLPVENAAAHRRVDSLFDEVKRLQRYSSRRAMILSAILPGLGQIYIGEYGAALNSLLLTGAFYTGFIVLSFRYSILDAGLSLLPWFRRYYVGGYEAASRLAKRKKQHLRGMLFGEILQTCADSQ
jgi:tetratricopeptide (TPR) repeat protein